MTIINPNSIAGITSVTAQADVINFFRSNGALAGLQLNGVNFNTTNGISTFNNLTVGGTLTYEDVKNVDSVGIISARTAIHVGAGISAVGIITATSFRGDGSQLTGISSPVTVDSYHNVFGGTDAGASLNSSSNNNVLFGQDAGDSINSGYENVCIGYRAGQALTSSRRNVCLGSDAGKDFTAGDSVFIGWTAGEDASANGNTAVGHNAGGNSRDNDTSFGYNAGPNTSYSGGNNVCVGKSAGNGLRSSAGKNTYIGPNCVGDTANGSYNIALGYEAELSQASISNECVIGDDAGNDGQITRFAVRGAKFVANTSGVGIGTTNPQKRLEVYDGDIYLNSTDKKIFLSNDYDQYITANAASNYLVFGTANAERLRIDATGKIGINNNSPNRTVNITSATGGNCDVELKTVNNTGWCQLIFSDTDAAYRGAIAYSHTNDFMSLYTANSERLRINASGAFGLGGATYGSSGQVLTSAGSGSVPTWSTISGTTINSNADDRVITGSGTANTLTGEANLTYSSSFLLKNTTATSTNNTQLLRLENTHSDGKMTVLGFRTTGLGSPQTKIYGGNDNSGAGGQGGTSGAGKFKVTITNPSGMDQEVIYAENDANSASKFVRFSTDGTERLRIKSDGEIVMNAQAGVAYDTDSLFVNGPSSSGRPTMEVHGNGNNSPSANSSALHIKQNCTNAPDTAAALKITHTNPLAGQEGALITCYSNINNSTAQRSYGFFSTGRIIQNRPNNDGTLISFRHNNTAEGSISISGGSVSYNGGVLTRWSQFVGLSTTSKAARPTIYQGTVMSNLDEMCEWTGEDNQQLNKTKVSTASGDKNVAGVFWGWDEEDDETGYVNDFYVAQTGDFIVRVGASVTVARGDLLESAGDGTAKPQSDDIVRSKTIAKIISTTVTATYADGSKAYPCLLMAS